MPPNSPEGSARLFEIVGDALALPVAERASFLTTTCEGNAVLLAEARSLLEHETRARGFLERPAFRLDPATLDAPPRGELEPGTVLGDYEMVRLLGQGGMGEVYLARDTKLERPVAVKLLKHNLDEGSLRRRFQHEQKVLAALTHPNIARLYSGNTTPGNRCYLVMEYVEGEALDRYCQNKGLGVTDRLALFRKVCSAVAYAHQNLVIHRDLKPANIRVTPEGEPKLLDFGIARLLDSGGADPAEGHAGLPEAMTPGYASPEQILGETITTSTDVYSLGVVLYELLCGERPHRIDSRQPAEMARIIREQTPTRPSTVVARGASSGGPAALPSVFRRQLSGDLDGIVAMAMHAAPRRRYASVAQLSEDLRRRCEGLPVSARRHTLSYLAGKFVLRHKAWVGVALLAVVGLVTALTVIVWEARRANRRFEDVRHLANSILFEVEPQIANVSGTTVARGLLVTRALEYLDSLSQEAGADQALRRELASAYEKVGDVQGNPNVSNLGDIKAALVSYRKAQALRQTLVRAAPRDAQGRHELANNYEQVGSLLWWSDDTGGTRASYAEALDLRKTLLREQPRSADFRQGFASLQMRLSDVDTWAGQNDRAMDDLKEALPILQDLARERPADTSAQINVARCLLRVGAARKEAGRYDEAVAAFEQAQGIVEPITRREPDNAVAGLQYCIELMSECETYNVQNTQTSTENARTLGPRMVRAVKAFAAKDPRNTGVQHDLASGYYCYGETLLHAGQWQQALDPLEKGLLIDTKLGEQAPENGEYTHSCGYFHLDLGEAKLRLDQVDAAADHTRKAEELLKAAVTKDPDNHQPQRELVTARILEGKICLRRQQATEARRCFEQALADLTTLSEKKVTSPGDAGDYAFLREALANR